MPPIHNTMKRIAYTLLLLCSLQYAFAQDNEEARPQKTNPSQDEAPHFDKKNIFMGGSLSLGYSSGYGSYYDPSSGSNSYVPGSTFNIGMLPEVGYKVSKVFDVGLAGNINYYSFTSSQYSSDKIHNLVYGVGAFVRIRPIDEFFIQLMPEVDKTKQTSINSNYTTKYIIKSTSFLAGVGYKYVSSSENSFVYAVLLLDLGKDQNSPYKTVDQTGRTVPVPIFRVAYSFFPFRKNQ